MGTQTLLTSLFRYKAWANEMLFGAMTAVGTEPPSAAFRTAMRILNHAHIVDRIFVGNLQAACHGYVTNEPAAVPSLPDLFSAVRDTDRWYVDYAARIAPEELSEVIGFKFTDGKPARMSREEILAHVITHGGYHRGEVGRLLPQISPATSADVFAGYLHQSEPARRG